MAGETRTFGKDSLIPSTFDPRLILRIAPAVAEAAMASGVARKPILDIGRLCRIALALRLPLRRRYEAAVQKAKLAPKRVIYAEGEDERVLRAAQTVMEEGSPAPS